MTIKGNTAIPTSTAEQILSEIKYHGQQRAYDLQRTLSISNVAVHKQLRKLVKSGKIKKVGTAPLVLYVLADARDKNLIELEKIKRKITPTLRQARVKRASLFGSFVRGDNSKTSDIDVLVDPPERATLIDLVGIKQDLEEVLHKDVDVVTYNGLCPLLKDSVLSSQYPII